jgi:hypothetical protein
MRFAWLRKNSAGHVSGKQATSNQLIRMAYNVAWWIPILLTFIGTIDYSTGFVAFAIITLVRLVANLYLNNVLEAQQAESFPFRM